MPATIFREAWNSRQVSVTDYYANNLNISLFVLVPGRQPSSPLREISRLVILKMHSFRLQPPYGKRLAQ